nr:amidohydrolase family protein [Phenylobacterium glaciei]
MLRSAFMLIDDFGWTPQKALSVVAANPARSLGLDDRGEIAPGQRADLVRIARLTDGWPVPTEVWLKGVRTA